MNAPVDISPKTAIALARKEVAEENQRKAVEVLKTKLRELTRAQTVVDNIQREIDELELKIEQGNL